MFCGVGLAMEEREDDEDEVETEEARIAERVTRDLATSYISGTRVLE